MAYPVKSKKVKEKKEKKNLLNPYEFGLAKKSVDMEIRKTYSDDGKEAEKWRNHLEILRENMDKNKGFSGKDKISIMQSIQNVLFVKTEYDEKEKGFSDKDYITLEKINKRLKNGI